MPPRAGAAAGAVGAAGAAGEADACRRCSSLARRVCSACAWSRLAPSRATARPARSRRALARW